MPTSPTLLEFPVVGADGERYQLSEAQAAEWAALFPGLDARQEFRNALAWVLANPGRRKTVKDMPRFLVGWLTRSNDRGRGRAPEAPTNSVRATGSTSYQARVRAAQAGR